MAGSKLLQTSLHLYAYLLRKVRLLPAEVQPYYRNYIRQNFRQHADEDDPENIRIMTSTAISDMDWLLAKPAVNAKVRTGGVAAPQKPSINRYSG
ncbi:LYR motif-containing protein 9 [Echinococcus granulosus]|nr:LYR motif-containing protein 9 [Echinococcus granulosus]